MKILSNCFWGLSLPVFFLLISCNNNSHNGVNETRNQIKKDKRKNPSGKYVGITPCADCPGIKTTIYFKDDSIFIENLEYLDREASFSDTGVWKIDNKIITVSFTSHQSYFKIISDSSIVILDAERHPIKGTLAEKFILKKHE